MENRNILVIEDEHDIAELLKLHLGDIYSDVIISNDGNQGLQMATSQEWDLILLDIRLPGIDGLEICRRIRQDSGYTPILMLTSKSSELDRVLGLEIGADDYLTKPFSIIELMARVKAIFRRISATQKLHSQEKSKIIRTNDLAIDLDKRLVTIRNKPIELTAKEFDLLLHFASHPGKVYKRSELLDKVWGYGHDGYEHTVNAHINRLRAKIEEDPSNPKHIVTVWSVGYKFGL